MHQPGWNGHPRIGIVAVAGSTGGSVAMGEVLARLPADFPAPILYLQHLTRSGHSHLAELLQCYTVLKVRWARQGERITGGGVYICPAGSFFLVQPDGTLTLFPITTLRDALYGADRFFESVAATYGQRAVALVLSGAGWDATEGVCAVHQRSGTVLVQDEDSAFMWGMPKAAVATGCVDLVLPLHEIAPVLVNLVRDGYPLVALQTGAAWFARRGHVSVPNSLRNKLNRLLAVALKMQGTDLGNIQLLDRKTGTLAIVAQRGFGLDFLDYFARVGKQDESACARAMRDGAPVFIADVTTDPAFAAHRAIAASAGFRAVQSVPLIGREGDLLGILSTHFRKPHHLPLLGSGTLEQHARLSAHAIEQLSSVDFRMS
jgi:hypothetical protein